MKNLKVEIDGLTFVSHGKDQMTVWAGTPGESEFISAAAIGVMAVNIDDDDGTQLASEDVTEEAFDESMLATIARQWLIENPEHRPVTDAQREALKGLEEVIQDVVGDREVMGMRAVLLDHSDAVNGLTVQAITTMMGTILKHIAHGDEMVAAQKASLVEAFHGVFTAGFVSGQAFERRGYRL